MDKKERKEAIKQQTWLPAIIALIGALLIIVSVFLPYSTATGERREWLDKHPDVVVIEEMDLTAADMKNISMAQYAHMYNIMSEVYWHDPAVGVFYIVLVALVGGGALIAALFTWKRKPVGTIIFGALSYGAFSVMNSDFTDRGVIPSDTYDWGIAHTILPIAAMILALGAAWMIVKKIQIKKQLIVADSEETPAAN